MSKAGKNLQKPLSKIIDNTKEFFKSVKIKPAQTKPIPVKIETKPEINIPKGKENPFINKKTDFKKQNESQPEKNQYEFGEDAKMEREKLEKQENELKEKLKDPEHKYFQAIIPENIPIQLSSSEIKSLTNYHRALGEVFDANNSEMVYDTLNSPEYKEVQRLSEYGYSPVETSELFTKVNKIDLKDYSKNGITAYDTLYSKLSTTTIFGKTMKQALKDLVASEKYQNAPDYNPDIMQDSKVSLVDDIFINYTNHARNRLILNEPDYVNKQGLTLGQVEENRLEQKRTARLQERLKKNHELMKYFI